jgi:biopolymer transport protein ExbB/TolQ
VIRVEVILGIAASVVTLSAFFFKAWANLRAGRRVERYRKSIRDQSELELDRMRLELEEAQRHPAGQDS